jgi:hypothetical protein
MTWAGFTGITFDIHSLATVDDEGSRRRPVAWGIFGTGTGHDRSDDVLAFSGMISLPGCLCQGQFHRVMVKLLEILETIFHFKLGNIVNGDEA